MSRANPPAAAPAPNARIAFADNDPKLNAEMLNSEMSYGRVHCWPPILTRGGSAGTSAGAIECTNDS